MGKIIKSILRVIVVSVMGGLIYFRMWLKARSIPLSKINNFQDTEPNKWNKIDLPGTVNGDGSKFFMYSKKGLNNNLIILFSGGGAAWNAETATQPMSMKNLMKGREFGYYFSNIPFYTITLFTGIMDDKNKDNPFREWNFAYIPYSTADFHVGDTANEFEFEGEKKKVYFNGQKNTKACLEWIYKNFDNPEKLLICGDSAGAFGSAFWAPKIAGNYPKSKVYHFSDGAYMYSEKWPDIADDVWKADYEKTFGYKIGSDPIKSAFINNYKKMGGSMRYLHFNTLYDGTLASFQADINERDKKDGAYLNEWSKGLKESTKQIKSEVPDYCYYVTDFGYDEKKNTTPHTIMRFEHYTKADQDGVLFCNWLRDMVIEDKKYCVGSSLIEK